MAAANKSNPSNTTASAFEQPNEIRLVREYDAPLKAVWDAWADTEQAAKWWGPRGFTITTHGKDLRTGGFWKYTMHGPDGTDYPNYTLYHEVEPYKKLVYDHGGTETTPPLFKVTVIFSEHAGKTRMDFTMALSTPDQANKTRTFIKKAGGDSTWDRLGEYLAKERAGKEQFVINRSFAVSIEKMFDVWTNPDHFAKWLPPTGFEMKFIRADIRTGGTGFYMMYGTGDLSAVKMYGRTQYLEIRRPDRIVYTQQFCDEHENITRHPMAPTWPATMLTVVQLFAEGPERTRVTVTWEPYGEATSVEVETFVKARAGMTQGWTGSFDKLEGYLGGI
jgi:uncharacterized protein YndB with AHSA1/START domain